jgi:hypothetical protein
MLSYDDPRWDALEAGYRVPIDLRALLRRFERGDDLSATWDDLWQELFHQGDVGVGSFVAVPHLVRVYADRKEVDWNIYLLAATIELARAQNGNPDVPDWARQAYNDALNRLAGLATRELPSASNPETVRSMLGFLAVVYGARAAGGVLIDYTEDEIEQLLNE